MAFHVQVIKIEACNTCILVEKNMVLTELCCNKNRARRVYLLSQSDSKL